MPSVDFDRTTQVEASAESVWDVVTDVALVASWVTVVDDVDELEPLASYTAVLADRLGPFKLAADLDVEVFDVEAPRSLQIRAEGEDRQVASRIQIAARVSLAPHSRGTAIHVEGMYEVTGRVATLGSSMIRAKGEKILDQFFGSLEGHFS